MNKQPRQKRQSVRSRDKMVVPFNIRVSESEKAAFDQAAGIAGIPLSAWVRQRLRKAARAELEAENLSVPFIRAIMPE